MINVEYYKTGSKSLRKATFEHFEEAQLFWDTIAYLRQSYIVVSKRPKFEE